MPLSNSQYDEILREYHAKQIRNQRLAESRKKEVYKKNPRLKEIDDAVSTCSVIQARKLLNGHREALNSLHEEINGYREERLLILKEMGYTEDYFIPDYDCSDCKDSGFVKGQRCHCFKQRAIDLVYTQSNIKSILKEENFQTFSYKYYSKIEINPATGLTSLETMKKAVAECRRFIEEFDNKFLNLFLYGDTGVGKTFLSNCVAKELLDTGHSVIYFTAFQLFDIFEKNTFRNDGDSDIIAAHQNIFDCDLLIIDDLGTEMRTEFVQAAFYRIVNDRLLHRRKTVLSTNLDIEDIARRYGDAVLSRLRGEYQLLRFFGEDIRLLKRK